MSPGTAPPGKAAVAVVGRVGSTWAGPVCRLAGTQRRQPAGERGGDAGAGPVGIPDLAGPQVVEDHRRPEVDPERRTPPGQAAQLAPAVVVLQHLVRAPLADGDDRDTGGEGQAAIPVRPRSGQPSGVSPIRPSG